jgi:succinyl-diaminopimelate desuccinylase
MPHLGRSAIDDMAALIDAVAKRLRPELAKRVSAMPIVPDESRRASINVNAVRGGQAGQQQQSPCVADRCVATFDRRFIAEESYDEVRAEVLAIVRAVEAEQPGRRYTIEDRMVVDPVQAPDDSPVVFALSNAVARVTGSEASLVGSPGTYDQKHITRIGGVEHCVAYGPGLLEEAHQPDESCSIDDLVISCQVMALAVLELVG